MLPAENIQAYGRRADPQGLPMHSMLDSAMRHLAKYMDGWTDEDHLCAAATNLLMAMWTEEKKPEMMDIPTRFKTIDMGNGSCIKEPLSYTDVHDTVEED